MSEYSTIWLPMSPKVGFVSALGATHSIHLPIFLSGGELTAFKRGHGANFSPATLLYGILYGVSDDPPGVDMPISASYFRKALELLVPELGMPDLETMILTAGANIREDFGSYVSARIVKNGLKFVPESDKLKSDYIVDLWVAAEEQAEQNYLPVLREIVEVLKEINFQSVAPVVKNCLSYIATIAFTEIEPLARDAFIAARFTDADLAWVEKEKDQISQYLTTKNFSWGTLTIR